MKKSVLLFIGLLLVSNVVLTSCGTKMYAKSAYRQGHHATRHGIKAQARVTRMSKHFWF